ncbi:membrane integrity-associated transporter subunit PqiC [Thioalkalivibrio sp.]|uniref:PqiC family protein n=1 Tax=Thioalkalivibrio sp. TaxID=2093813 RepID=UPI00398338EF
MGGVIGRWLLVLSLIALVGGCTLVPKQPAVDRAWFLLEPPAASPTEAAPVLVELGSVRVAPAIAGKGLVYRLGPHRYESDFYNEWFLNPRDHVEQLLRERWTVEDGPVRLVADARAEPDARQVDVLLTGLHADLDGPSPGAAVVGLRVFVQGRERMRLWELDRRTPLASRSPEALVAALSGAMTELLVEIERRLEM